MVTYRHSNGCPTFWKLQLPVNFGHPSFTPHGMLSAGLTVRVIFLGRELADCDSLASHLRLPARAAAAGPCATSSAAPAYDTPGVTLHAVLSNRPPSSSATGVAGRTHAGAFRGSAWLASNALVLASGPGSPCSVPERGAD